MSCCGEPPKRRNWLVLGGILITIVGLGIAGATASEPVAQAPTDTAKAYWVKRTDAELDAVIEGACTDAVANKRQVLLTFSATWCGDCRKIKSLEAESPLREELEQHWNKVVVDVGRFDRHEKLIEQFGVSGIAHLVALSPSCGKPVGDWTILRSGKFEPATNPDGVRTAAGLAKWLTGARTETDQ